MFVDPGVGHNKAKGRKLGRGIGDQGTWNRSETHEIAGVNRAGSSGGDQGKIPWIKAALQEDRAEGSQHIVISDLHDGQGGDVDRHLEWFRDLLDRHGSGFLVQRHPSTKKVVWIDAAENNVGIGHGWQLATPPVAGGTGRCAG